MDLQPYIFLSVPSTYRPIANFVGEIKKSLRGIVESRQNLSVANHYFRTTIYAVNHCFQMIEVVGYDPSDVEMNTIISKFEELRELLLDDFGEDDTIQLRVRPNPKGYNFDANEILFAEADELFQFAKEQLQEGFRIDASRNFHYAAIFYRVIEALFPSVRPKMMQAAALHRQTAPLVVNFVPEYLTGAICADNYEVHGSSKIGKGSYGSVYRATHIITGDERAVKVLNVDTITSYYLKKLHTELIILKEVDHPNIVRLQEVYFGKRSVYLVTDLCRHGDTTDTCANIYRGGELYEYLTGLRQKGHSIPEPRIASLMKDVLCSLRYLHSKNIVHRDLKLENFLFRDRSPDSDLVLIDFGLSKHFDATERIAQRVGSCYYTAPEVLHVDYDQRCDVWSAGVICYMLMTGSPPFTGSGPDMIHQAILTKAPDFSEKKFKHISQLGVDFVSRLLRKDPSERMSLAEALNHPFISPPIPLSTSSLPTPIPPKHKSRFHLSLKKITKAKPNQTSSQSPASILSLFAPSTLTAVPYIVAGLKMFSSLNVFIRMVLKCIAHSISEEQHATCRVLFHDLDVHRKGYLTVHDFLAAVDTPARRTEVEAVFINLPISFPVEHQLPPTIGLSTSLSCSSVSSIPLEISTSRRSFSEQQSDSSLQLPPANPTLTSSTSSSKLSSIFKFLGSSKTPPPQNSIDRSHSGDDRISGSGSSTAGLEKDEYEKDVILTYNDFIASFLCHHLADHLDRALVVFRYLDTARNDNITVSSVVNIFGQEVDEVAIKLAFRDLLETVYKAVVSDSTPLSMSSVIFRQAWVETGQSHRVSPAPTTLSSY